MSRLTRDWYFTPSAEWIAWQCPDTGKYKGFRVILTDVHRFLEWSAADGYVAGRSDDGETPGRAKMSAVLEARPGMEREVASLVRALVDTVRREPPRMNGVKVDLPPDLLDFIEDRLVRMEPAAR